MTKLIGELELNRVHQSDCIDGMRGIPDESIQTCVTSPPYFAQRDYGIDGQLGLEKTPEEYVNNLVDVFSEVRRILKEDGTLWLNLGDSYWNSTFIREKSADGWANKGDGDSYDKYYASNGGGVSGGKRRSTKHEYLKVKDLVGIPWLVALALQKDGWYLRSDIIWNKTNPMPEPTRDRPSKSHEYLFLLSKNKKYYYNKLPDVSKTVWNVGTTKYKGAHFATFPPELIEPCVLQSTKEKDIVFDPFFGSGTTGLVSIKNNRNFVATELNPDYILLANQRIESVRDELAEAKITEQDG